MNLDKTLQSVIGVIKEVGDFLLTEFRSFDRSKVEYKGVNDLVSYVDKEAEQRLIERLGVLLPEAGFIAEEGTKSHDSEELLWVIDPLDGTTNFTHGLPVFAVSIGLITTDHQSEHKPILGVIYDPSRDQCFYATQNGRSYCNQKVISVSQTPNLEHCLVATGFPYSKFDQIENYLELLESFITKSQGVRRMGSAAIDLAYVASGRFEGFFEYNLNAWDVAAGALIVERAGGIVTDYSGGNNFLFGRQILAANTAHSQMLKLIQEHFN